MQVKKDKLLLFTLDFPFSFGDPIIENEIGFLARSFREVIIIPKNANTRLQQRPIPSNCSVRPIETKKRSISALPYFFSRGILSELFYTIFSQNTLQKIKVLLEQVLIANHSIQILKTILQKNSSEVVYSYWTDDSAIAFALIRDQYPRSTFISRAHGWDVYFERHHPAYLPLRKFMSEKLDNIYFISENGLNYFKAINGVNTNCGEISRLGTKDPKARNIIQENGILRLVSCSSVIPLKRVGLIVDALAKLTIPFHWCHIGTGPLLEDVQQKAKKLLNTDQYTFLGQMENLAVIDFYKNEPIDLLINVSTTEGIPVSMMEVMSFGIPCIGTNVGGVEEIIIEGETGYLLSSNPDVSEISVKIHSYFQLNKQLKQELRDKTQLFWSKNYSADANYPRFIKEIQST